MKENWKKIQELKKLVECFDADFENYKKEKIYNARPKTIAILIENKN